MGNRKTNRYNGGQGNQTAMARNLDELAAFESFKTEILPKIQDMMRQGKSAEDIYSFSQSYAAARGVTIAMTSKDEKTALAAIKEVLDRGVGKAADKLEVTTRYANLPMEELQALIQSQEEELAEQDQLPN
jgi:hypothetical protein